MKPADRSEPEPATGFTLYTDTILRTPPAAALSRRLLLPIGVDRALSQALREGGWTTIAALEPARDWRAEARRLGCSYFLDRGAPVKVG